MVQAGGSAARINAGAGTGTPFHQVSGSQAASGTACIQRGVARFGRIAGIGQDTMTHVQAVEGVRIVVGVAVNNHVSHSLAKAFNVRDIFAAAEGFLVRSQRQQFHVHFGTGLQDAAGVYDLVRAGLGVAYTFVDVTNIRLRDAVTQRGLVAGSQVAFHPGHIVQDWIAGCQHFNDFVDLTANALTFTVIIQR